MINVNQWSHVAVTFNLAGTASLYINCQLVGAGSGYLMNYALRTTNYIGRSNWGDSDLNAVLDEVKIFNRPLSMSEIATEMKKPQPLNIINF